MRIHIPKHARQLRDVLSRYWVHGCLVIGACLAVVTLVMVFAPQSLAYTFEKQQTCTTSPRFLPATSQMQSQHPFVIERPASLVVGRVVLYSHTLCATANAVPRAQHAVTYKERVFGWPLLGHTLSVKTTQYASIKHMPAQQDISPTGTLRVPLTKPDQTFTYAAAANGQSVACRMRGANLACDLSALRLGYAQAYDVQLVRMFSRQQVSKLGTAPIKTITPTTVVLSSVAAGAQVQHKPTNVVLQTDKIITSMGAVTFVAKASDGTGQSLPATPTFKDKTITIAFGKELPRKTTFELRIASVVASDGSGFVGTSYALGFSTSGGPKVAGVNISSRNISQTPKISVRFDQSLLASQDPNVLASFLVHGKPYPAGLAIAGNSLVITPQGNIPLCAPVTIKINEKVQSQFGIGGDSVWQFNSRTICYTTFSIGTSVRGRPITAYQFGSGSNPVVYVGAMHGSESNAKRLMTEWFNELNAHSDKLGGRSLVVIPSANPDGVAAGSRLNARGVDLNRNFPANDWKSMVTSPESPNPSPAGGPSPLSEPESSALAAYIRRVSPRVVISFHSAAAVVEANEAGDSVGIASAYASRARYRAVPKSQSAPVFKYDTTGAMEDWMRDKLGSPAIVVELLSKTSSEFARNRNALWYTTGL